jgi:tight adherence protein C
MNQSLISFIALSLLAAMVYLLGLGLLNCRRLIRGDWADENVNATEERRFPEWMRWLASSVPQLQIELNRLRRDISRAGIYAPDALERLLAIRNGLVWCSLFSIPLVLILVSSGALTVIGLGILVAAVFYSLPGLFLNARGRVRAGGILGAIPEILDIISMCLSGGLTLEQALPRIVEYSPHVSRDLTNELKLVVRQANASSAGTAFHQLAERIDEVELRSLAATVQHTERLGTDMKRAIDSLSQSIRATLKHDAEARANSLSLKLLFPIIFCISPPVFFVLVVPPIIKLRDHFQREFLPSDTRQALQSSGTAPSTDSPPPPPATN